MSHRADRILSFDPGETTGIAFVEKGYLGLGINAQLNSFQNDDFLPILVKLLRPTCIVIETPPQAARFNVTSHVSLYDHLVRWFTVAGFHVVLLNPGQWKKMISRSEVKSTHIRDAADMARYVYKEMRNDQIGKSSNSRRGT